MLISKAQKCTTLNSSNQKSPSQYASRYKMSTSVTLKKIIVDKTRDMEE